ncbi:MAG: 4Fe-4S binding protein [Candidatus Bathyarchaeota archaeon]|nr:4Fe-4S binding protein [Candidatus Bathyarchaeum tardum]WGM88625.1 MAG: 4Fe-4S binding protein [Candidatus Bathyarchaeum tardum]WNZ29119.1 MAG: 4Fe-4S binding protein [Candidatus Bathyarchaeota archaeon]
MTREITILSGKGGTGKTSVTASLAVLAKNAVITDCDVDAPDLHMLLNPAVLETQEFKASRVAVIDSDTCVQCRKCEEHCRFGAITQQGIDPILCEGCGVCVYVCPLAAIKLEKRVSGQAFISKTEYGLMSHALLNPGEENSGKLVSLVRKNAKKVAEKENCDLIINDGPPGIGCPVIASVGGVDLGIIVVEPTLSGIHDMIRALELLNHFKISAQVCINKYDLNEQNTLNIILFCEKNKVDVVGKIPFDSIFTEAMVAGKPVIEHAPDSKVSNAIKKIWRNITQSIE